MATGPQPDPAPEARIACHVLGRRDGAVEKTPDKWWCDRSLNHPRFSIDGRGACILLSVSFCGRPIHFRDGLPV